MCEYKDIGFRVSAACPSQESAVSAVCLLFCCSSNTALDAVGVLCSEWLHSGAKSKTHKLSPYQAAGASALQHEEKEKGSAGASLKASVQQLQTWGSDPHKLGSDPVSVENERRRRLALAVRLTLALLPLSSPS